MSGEQNKAVFRKVVNEIFIKGNTDLVDEMLAPGFIEHEELPPGIPGGREGLKQMIKMFRSAFPDFNTTIEDMVAEGDKVVVRWTWSGTHKGDFMGIPPTGRSVSFGVIDIVRIVNDKFVEHWGLMDSSKLMQQLGVVPA